MKKNKSKTPKPRKLSPLDSANWVSESTVGGSPEALALSSPSPGPGHPPAPQCMCCCDCYDGQGGENPGAADGTTNASTGSAITSTADLSAT